MALPAILLGAAVLASTGASIYMQNQAANTPVKDSTFKTAELLREQFDDWQNTFKPIEVETMQQISFNNASVLPTALNEAEETVAKSYKTMGGVLERQNKSLGIQPTEQQKKTSSRLLNLGKSLATADAKNKTRANIRAMDEQILTGITPNPNIAK